MPRHIPVSAQGMDNLGIWSSVVQNTANLFTLPESLFELSASIFSGKRKCLFQALNILDSLANHSSSSTAADVSFPNFFWTLSYIRR